MNILLFDTLSSRKKLFPLTLTRAIADLRMGILTVKERWEKLSGSKAYVLTEPYLQHMYEPFTEDEYLLTDPCVMPSRDIVKRILALQPGEILVDEKGLVAGYKVLEKLPAIEDIEEWFSENRNIETVKRLEYPFHIFQWNEEVLQFDFRLVTKGRISHDNIDTIHQTNASQIFIEEGAHLEMMSFLNASAGPIYIGKNATVMEGCLIRGPFALCEGATLKMGTKIYGATTIGPVCMAAGEIKNCVLTGYSNKPHDGYLGDSVIGEWCNLGAGTNNSNTKNTGTEVKVWNYYENNYIGTSLKCGLIMGDHSRTAINTSINTGTVVGVCCNIFGEGLTPKTIHNFTWGTKEPRRYELEKAFRDLENWKKMKNKSLSNDERDVLKYIFDNYND